MRQMEREAESKRLRQISQQLAHSAKCQTESKLRQGIGKIPEFFTSPQYMWLGPRYLAHDLPPAASWDTHLKGAGVRHRVST